MNFGIVEREDKGGEHDAKTYTRLQIGCKEGEAQ